MARITGEIVIEAPAEAVWDVLAHRFDRIGEWATAIRSSGPRSNPGGTTGAAADVPVEARVCQTGVRLAPEVEERVVAYDEPDRTLTYQADKLPGFLRAARNTWHVEAIGDQRSRVTFDGTIEPRGITGWLLQLVLRAQLARTAPQTLDDLKHYVERGHPSPRKQRQLDAER